MVIRSEQVPQAKKKPGGCLLSRRKGSIIGVRELDFRVRYGNGYFLSTMATGHISMSSRTRSMRPLRPAARARMRKREKPGNASAESTIWSSLTTY